MHLLYESHPFSGKKIPIEFDPKTCFLQDFEGMIISSSIAFSKMLGIKHVALLNLIKKYEDEINNIYPLKKRQEKTMGRPASFYVLNWEQIAFITTLLKNNPTSIKFKKDMLENTKLFFMSDLLEILFCDIRKKARENMTTEYEFPLIDKYFSLLRKEYNYSEKFLMPFYKRTKDRLLKTIGFEVAISIISNSDIKKPKEYVYIIKKESGLVKIGRSINIKKRLRTLETQNGEKIIRKYISEPLENAPEVESSMHKHFVDYRRQGEWFNIDFDKAVDKIAEVIPKTIVPMTEQNLIS